MTPTAPGHTRELVEHNGRHTATFTVPAEWIAWKYDAAEDARNRFYQDTVKKAAGVSAVDFVAHDAARDTLVLVECKDFRGDTPANLPRLGKHTSDDEKHVQQYIKDHKLSVKVERSKANLADEFAKKVRDTLSGLLAASRAKDPALGGLAPIALAGRPLVCVLSLELDPPASWQPGEGVRLLSRLKSAMERELSFLQNVEVVICSGLNRQAAHHYDWQLSTSPKP